MRKKPKPKTQSHQPKLAQRGPATSPHPVPHAAHTYAPAQQCRFPGLSRTPPRSATARAHARASPADKAGPPVIPLLPASLAHLSRRNLRRAPSWTRTPRPGLSL